MFTWPDMILGQLLINGHVTAVRMPEGPKSASLSECPAGPPPPKFQPGYHDNKIRRRKNGGAWGVGWWVNVPSLELSKKGAHCWGAVIPVAEIAS